MKTVFADTMYWIAVVNPHDSWAKPAKRAKSVVGNVRLLTTDEVLGEFLAALSRGGTHLRQQAVKMVREILSNPNVKVLQQSRVSFIRGVELYEKRLDKEYSLTDCCSMNAMKTESVTDVSSNDKHFAQEGFRVLITRNSQKAS